MLTNGKSPRAPIRSDLSQASMFSVANSASADACRSESTESTLWNLSAADCIQAVFLKRNGSRHRARALKQPLPKRMFECSVCTALLLHNSISSRSRHQRFVPIVQDRRAYLRSVCRAFLHAVEGYIVGTRIPDQEIGRPVFSVPLKYVSNDRGRLRNPARPRFRLFSRPDIRSRIRSWKGGCDLRQGQVSQELLDGHCHE